MSEQVITGSVIGKANKGLKNYGTGCFEIILEPDSESIIGDHLVFNQYDLIRCASKETLLEMLTAISFELRNRN